MPSDLEYDQILGEGQIVFKDTYRGQLCAVKKLKEGVDNGSLEYERLLLELSVLAGVGAHPNLVHFFGACVQDILEYERLLLELTILAGVGAHPNLVYFFRACVQDLSAPWQ